MPIASKRPCRTHSPDALVHLAARIDLDEKTNLAGYAANIEGVENLVEAVRLTPSIRRGIWTSSQLVCRVGYVPRATPITRPTRCTARARFAPNRSSAAPTAAGANGVWRVPTTVWGPGMSAHYQRFLRMIERGYYFHVGHGPLWKSYSYIDNIAFQYWRLLAVPPNRSRAERSILPTTRRSISRLVRRLSARVRLPRHSASASCCCAHIGALRRRRERDGMKKFPFNSFRLNNVLTQYQFDLRPTASVCGDLPFDMEQGVAATVAGLRDISAH